MASSEVPVSVGQIRVYSHTDFDKMGLVIGTSSIDDWFQFVPVHPYREYACQHDFVIEPEVSGLSYAIVVMSDIRTTLPGSALKKLVVTLPESATKICRGSKQTIPGVYQGVPLLGGWDSRKEFRHAETSVLATITKEHLADLFGLLEP